MLIPLESAEGMLVAATIREISERKRFEKAIEEALATIRGQLKELADQKLALDQHAIVAVTDAGAKAFLQKPIDDAELLAVVRQALERPCGRMNLLIMTWVEYDEEDLYGEHQNLKSGVGEPRTLGMAVRTRPVTKGWGKVRTGGPSYGVSSYTKTVASLGGSGYKLNSNWWSVFEHGT
jgi:hypothetical protein